MSNFVFEIEGALNKSLDKFKKEVLVKRIEKAGDFLLTKIKENTPIDTGNLANSYESKTIQSDKLLTRQIVNKTSYARPVEGGVKGKVYTYYKRRGAVRSPFYSGVGAQMMERAVLQNTSGVISILNNG